MDVSTMLNDLLVGVREAHSDLVDREVVLKDQLTEVVTEKRRLESVIKAAQGPQPKPEPEPEPARKPSSVSDEMVDAVKSAIMGLGQHEALPGVKGTFTTRDLAETEVASQPTVSAALRLLRERGEVRVCGTLDAPGSPKAYALVGHDGDGN